MIEKLMTNSLKSVREVLLEELKDISYFMIFISYGALKDEDKVNAISLKLSSYDNFYNLTYPKTIRFSEEAYEYFSQMERNFYILVQKAFNKEIKFEQVIIKDYVYGRQMKIDAPFTKIPKFTMNSQTKNHLLIKIYDLLEEAKAFTSSVSFTFLSNIQEDIRFYLEFNITGIVQDIL